MRRNYKKTLVFTLAICLLLISVSAVHAEETIDYDALFDKVKTGNPIEFQTELMNAFFIDTLTFMEEVSYQNVQVKQTVIDIFISDPYYLPKIKDQVSYLNSYFYSQGIETSNSENNFRRALSDALSYQSVCLPSYYREFSILFDEVLMVNEAQFEGFADELSQAAIAEPANMIHLLAHENEQVQEAILVSLWTQYYTFRGTVLKEKLTAIRDTEDFTDEELGLLDTIVGYYAESPTVTPPSDPDPEELKAWLEKKQPVATEPTGTDPPPTQTDPTDPEPTESPDEPQKENNDRLWITVSLCFLAGCIGLLIGVLVHQRKET